MSDKGLNRKLAAILSADVKGYSRLMGEDEDFTVATLTAYRAIMTALIEQHRGRVVDSPGDNLLAEFASAVNAVRCALEIQAELKVKNSELPENRRMEFRIGINIGDVIQKGKRIYGDGVNIASRMEGLAEAGGVSISGPVFEQIENKLNLGYAYQGEQTVKNISKPVHVYRILTETEGAGKLVGPKKLTSKTWRRILVTAGVLTIGFTALVVWNYYFRSNSSPDFVSTLQKPGIPLAERASIAVLPFNNLSGDSEQEYFSDGITNDIITDLSKFSELLVIASNTVFTYKGKPINVKVISQTLRVRYVLQGSVQKLSNKVRINAQLIDATTGQHLWAERYEKDIKDLFTVQDEIVQTIVTKLAIKVGKAERVRAMRKDTQNLAAYDYLLRGWEHYNTRTRSANIKAKEMFKKAIAFDPDYADAYVGLGWVYHQEVMLGWTEFPARSMQKAIDLVNKTLTLDESNAGAHALLGTFYVYQGEYNLAFSELQRAIVLNPNHALSNFRLGTIFLYSGHPDEAIEAVKTAFRFDPNLIPSAHFFLGMGYYLKGQYRDAIETLKVGVRRMPDFLDLHVALAATYAQSGRQEDAVRAAETVRKLNPFFEVDSYGTAFRNPADRAEIVNGLRKAGLK